MNQEDTNSSPAQPMQLFVLLLGLALLGTGALCGSVWVTSLDRWFEVGIGADAKLGWLAYSGLSLGTLFLGGIGGLVVYNLARATRETRCRDQAKRLHPDEPWRWLGRWTQSRLPAGSWRRMVQVCTLTLVWNIMALPLCLLVYREVTHADKWLALSGLFLPAMGCVLAFWSIRLFVHWFAFRESSLEMTPAPGIIGGALLGKIHTEIKNHPADGYQVTLRCIKMVRDGRRWGPATATVAWQDSRFIAADPVDNSVPVLFAIPFDALPSTLTTSDVQWRLGIRAHINGLDYRVLFEVPVFSTAQSVPDFRPDESEIAPFLRQPDQKARLSLYGITTQTLPDGGRRILFPMGRQRMAGLLSIFLLHLWLVLTLGLSIPSGLPWPFKLALILSNGIVLYGTLNLWFHQSRIEVSQGRLCYSAGWIKDRHSQVFTLADIASMICLERWSPWAQHRHFIRLTRRDGRKTTIARHLPSEAIAETLRGQLRKHLLMQAIPTPPTPSPHPESPR